MTNIINNPNDFQTDDITWWMIFEPSTLNIIVNPNLCSGKTSSPFTMVTSDNPDELNNYIVTNNLVYIDNPIQPDTV
jgi:hypothetical protein